MPKRSCTFNEELQKEFTFLKKLDSEVECGHCGARFSVVHGRRDDINQHIKTDRHQRAVLAKSCKNYRKQARHLENEIDLKLVSFSKLGTSYLHGDSYSDKSPLLNSSGSEHMFEAMEIEIEQLLRKLTEVNDRMSEYTQNISIAAPNAALLHTLQRHRDILQDYSQEFHKTKSNINAIREREDLLGAARRDINAYKNSSGLNRRMDLYLKENEHIRNSERLVDDQISVAIATKENLESQKKSLSGIAQKMYTLANRFPLINSLMQRIHIRKRRDSIILASVTATCVIVLLLYLFH